MTTTQDDNLVERPWRCDVTGNPVGTDTKLVSAPSCECQGCRAAARIRSLEAEVEELKDERGVILGDMRSKTDDVIASVFDLQEAREEKDTLHSQLSEALELLERSLEAVNASYAQAQAEWQGHDRAEEKHDKTCWTFRNDVRAFLSRTKPQPAKEKV